VARAGNYGLRIDAGADWSEVWTWKVNDAAVNLTGYTATLVFRERADSAAVLTLTSSPAAGLVLGGAAGTITPSLTPAQTLTLQAAFTSGVYDLELVSSGGVQRKLLRGSVVIYTQGP
jgi:hypothetical protein